MEYLAVIVAFLAFGLASGTLPMVIRLRRDVEKLKDELNRSRGS